MNERNTENIVRDFFRTDSMIINGKAEIEEQSSANPRVNKLLRNASKSGKGRGMPEFLITFSNNSDLIIVIECKASINKHCSGDLDKPKDYAVDGVKLYSSYLAKEYDVIAIAVSGDKQIHKISHFLQLKGSNEAAKIFEDDSFLKLDDYISGYLKDERKFNQDLQSILSYSKKLNEQLHALKVRESERSLLISGILIALNDKAFISSYSYKEPKPLTKLLTDTICERLTKINQSNVESIKATYSFIPSHTILSEKKGNLVEIIKGIDKEVNSFIKTHEFFDILGQFYIEFLRYANNDKGLGIVLTPPHVTDLFCELADITKDSVVLDTCTGTGGFLISAMNKMIKDANFDSEKINNIKRNQIIGIEQDNIMHTLLCSNMFIHEDGRSSLYKGSCFDDKIISEIKDLKPNIGFLNPPYKDVRTDPEEFEFILNNLSQLEKGSKCIAIVPLSCALASEGVYGDSLVSLKEKILSNHTLDAVFSMPHELFVNSKTTVTTCIMIFISGNPHPKNFKTYFADFRDDGYAKKKTHGRADYEGKHKDIKNSWLSAYKNRDEIYKHSIKKIVTAKEEWSFESYFEIDYGELNNSDFISIIREYIAFSSYHGEIEVVKPYLNKQDEVTLQRSEWGAFNLQDIFEISLGSKIIHNNSIKSRKETYTDGFSPYVTRKTNNNGIEEGPVFPYPSTSIGILSSVNFSFFRR